MTTVGPVVDAEPRSATVIGKVLVTPSFNAGEGVPTVVVRSGVPNTAGNGPEPGPLLLPGFESSGVVVVGTIDGMGRPVTVVGPGVIGRVIGATPPTRIGSGSVQVTVLPLVVQVKGLPAPGVKGPAGR